MQTTYLKFLLIIISLFSLMILTSSCSETETINQEFTEIDQEIKGYLLPYGFDKKGEEFAAEILSNADDSELDLYAENYRVAMFLVSENLITDIISKLNYGENISELNLNKHLTNTQFQNLSTFKTNPSNADYQKKGPGCRYVVGGPIPGSHCHYVYKRCCSFWGCVDFSTNYMSC